MTNNTATTIAANLVADENGNINCVNCEKCEKCIDCRGCRDYHNRENVNNCAE